MSFLNFVTYKNIKIIENSNFLKHVDLFDYTVHAQI